MRTNIYKAKIIKLFKNNHLLSLSDIHKKILGIDYSTVYRNIEYLVADGELKKIVFDKDKVMYEINDKQNCHDHFLCIDCGAIAELHRLVVNVKSLKGHSITDILVRGLCKNCN